ncbi:hypothetical protein, partial [Pyxidicoccus fallax]|uniref:hypothetical protein n=1 Tax=Pyxidicoccus fallax TaxID=394095 RepID=UPI001B7D4D4D
MPVHEGEVKELGLSRRAPRQVLPEAVEDLAKAALRLLRRQLEVHACDAAEFGLGPLAHLPREARLAAIAPVEAAH